MPGPGLDLIGEEEAAEVMEVITSRELSRYRFDDDGTALPSKVYLFERELESLTKAKHCLGMNSCTSALLTGMWASGIRQGDEVIVPGYTFIASIAAIAYTGAIPVLAEIDDSLTIDPLDVARKITPRTKAILVVHMLGVPCNMDALQALADENNLLLFEDCAQAGGGKFKHRSLGTFGTYGAFSLNVFKTFTAGDGGALLTNDTEIYKQAFAIHDHGSFPNRVGVIDANSFLGLNFRMHELTGAVALAQVRKLTGILEKLRANKAKLVDAIGTFPHVRERKIHDVGGECATVLTYIFDSEREARRVANNLGTITLADSGKHNYSHMPQLAQRTIPIHNPEFKDNSRDISYEPGSLPQTDDLLSRCVSLSVGVSDSYLGSGFGINIHSDEAEIERIAAKFAKQLK